MNKLHDEYLNVCNTISDINEHIPLLYQLAKDCKSIVEFGVRDGQSTRAFLYSNTPLKSYDLELDSELESLFNYSKQQGNSVEYIKANTLDISIDSTDLLFIDTLHTYNQLKQELKLHGNKATKYIVLHDIISYGLVGEDDKLGLIPAIMEFLIENPHWKIKHFLTNNNGLLVLDNINNVKQKWRQTQYPTLEITTSVPKKGCVVNCNFCPQNTLVGNYNGPRELTLSNFKSLLNKIPVDIRIIFSGLVEPWLNKDCTNMLLYAYERGHDISVFTTGIGMTIKDFQKIKHIPFFGDPNGGFVLHVPDNAYNAKHPITSKYINLLEYINSIKHEISNFEVMSMGPIHDSIEYIFKDDYRIYHMHTRANNLTKEFDIKPELYGYPFTSLIDHGTANVTCNCREKLYHNVLLPNGDVSLCCMDYSLKYILGNLYTDNYNDILPENNTPFEICRYCENGIAL